MQPFQQQMQGSANANANANSDEFNAAVTKLEGMDMICKQKLWQYESEWNSGRPADNDISFWRNFVAKYYAPDSKRRFCMSALKHQPIMSMQRTKEKWCCNSCKQVSDKCRIEYSFEEMAENFQRKFEMGMTELLLLGPGKIRNSRNGHIAILCKNMKLISKGQSSSRSSMGELVVVFNAELKISQWNCCMRHSEESIFKTSLSPRFASPTEILQLANTKESQRGINESGGDPQFEEFMKMIMTSQVHQGTMHRQGSIAQTKPALYVGSGSGNDSNSDMLMPLVRQCFGSMNSPQNNNNFTEMDPHPGQQATQQRMEVNTSNNDSNNTAPSNLEEEEMLRQEHQRLEIMMDDILKAESIDEIYALIASITK